MFDLLATVLIWGLSFALAKKALNTFHPLELVTLRLGLAALTAWLIDRFLAARSTSSLRSRTWKPAVILGIFEFAGTYIFYTWSLRYLPSGVVGTLTLLTPVFVYLCGLVVRVQRSSLRATAAILLSVAGGWLCVPAEGILHLNFLRGALMGVAFILFSNFLFAVGNVAISKFHLEGQWREGVTAEGLFLGACLSAVMALVSGSATLSHFASFSAWLLPLYLGIVATGLGFYLWNRGVRKVSAVPASLVGNLKAPLAVIWGAILLGESVTARLVVGLVVLVIAVQLLPRAQQLVTESG
jgi:drug/metabolite transporter (DMT)-like permease